MLLSGVVKMSGQNSQSPLCCCTGICPCGLIVVFVLFCYELATAVVSVYGTVDKTPGFCVIAVFVSVFLYFSFRAFIG
jgi:phosphate starvation-inducible membrane PsiE